MNKETIIKRKEISVVHNVSDDKFDIIQVTSTYETTIGGKERKKKKIGESSRTTESFKLFEISLDQLEMLIEQRVPLFIYKDGERYFCTKIPRKLDIRIPNKSKCEIVWNECKFYKNGCTSYTGCIAKSNAISKAYETKNTCSDRVFIIECQSYCEK